MRNFYLLSVILLTFAPFRTQANIEVMASIKPLQLIANQITQGVTDTDVLLANTASPHDYALRPSDVRRLKSVDLFIWVGPVLEPFLTGVMHGATNSLQLDHVSQLDLITYDDKQAHQHDDGHHHQGNYDPHVWLGARQAEQIASVINDKLTVIDPANQALYQQNLVQFKQQLAVTTDRIKQQLQPVTQHGYYVFHDAYRYFENYFGLNNLGFFTVSPDRKPGAKTLVQIRTALRSDNVYCVFTEPQFTPALIQSVTRGSDVNIGQIDPLATDIKVEAGGYFVFLQQLADAYYHCLSAKTSA